VNAVEEIQAAIDKLTALKNEPIVTALFTATSEDTEWFSRTSKKLAIFHRTIDAQLSILASALEEIARWVDLEGEWGWEESDGPVPTGKSFQGKLDLARAINGVTS
jgi:hypothetical protein